MAIVTRTPKEQEDYGTTGYPEPEEEESKVSGILGSILGMGSAVGGMVPSLLKGGLQKRQLEKIQAGGGAGAAIARQTGSEAASRIIGASTAQPSSGRGGALREGLRAADQAVQTGAQQAAITGAREGLVATQMLRQNEAGRRGAFRMLGAGVGQGLAGLGATLASARDQGPQTETAGAEAGVVGQPAGVNPATEEIGVSMGPDEQAAFIEEMQANLQGLQEQRQQALPAGPTQEQGGPELRKQAGKPTSEIGQSLTQPSAQQAPQTEQAPQATQAIQQAASPERQLQSHVDSLADATTKKQEAAAGYIATAATPEAEANRTLMENIKFNPYWEELAIQLADSELTEEQTRAMLQITGAPPELGERLIQDALTGQRGMSLQRAAELNVTREKARTAGAFAGPGGK